MFLCNRRFFCARKNEGTLHFHSSHRRENVSVCVCLSLHFWTAPLLLLSACAVCVCCVCCVCMCVRVLCLLCFPALRRRSSSIEAHVRWTSRLSASPSSPLFLLFLRFLLWDLRFMSVHASVRDRPLSSPFLWVVHDTLIVPSRGAVRTIPLVFHLFPLSFLSSPLSSSLSFACPVQNKTAVVISFLKSYIFPCS